MTTSPNGNQYHYQAQNIVIEDLNYSSQEGYVTGGNIWQSMVALLGGYPAGETLTINVCGTGTPSGPCNLDLTELGHLAQAQ